MRFEECCIVWVKIVLDVNAHFWHPQYDRMEYSSDNEPNNHNDAIEAPSEMDENS